jgi:hypothetical protein
MRLVVIESPYAGDVDENLRYLRACMADCLRRGEAPFASHALYTQPGVLDDTKPEERELGIRAGFEWGRDADAVVVYADRGVSKGMMNAISHYQERGLPIEVRLLGQSKGGESEGLSGYKTAAVACDRSPSSDEKRCEGCGVELSLYERAFTRCNECGTGKAKP